MKLLDSVECYRPYSNVWTASAKLVKPTGNGKGAQVNDVIYIMDNQGNLQRYSPTNGECELVTRLHQCRKIHVVFPWRGKPHFLLSQVGCQLSCVHLYTCDDNNEQMGPLRLVAPCLALNTGNDVVFGFASPHGVTVVTTGATYLWNGQKWTLTISTSGKSVSDDGNGDSVRPLQPCLIRLPRYLLTSSVQRSK